MFDSPLARPEAWKMVAVRDDPFGINLGKAD
jgi:hypothetical protein